MNIWNIQLLFFIIFHALQIFTSLAIHRKMAVNQTWWMLLYIQKLILDNMLRTKSLSLWGTAKRNNFIESGFNYNLVKNTLPSCQRPQSLEGWLPFLLAQLRLKLTSDLALTSPPFRKRFQIQQVHHLGVLQVHSQPPLLPTTSPGYKSQHLHPSYCIAVPAGQLVNATELKTMKAGKYFSCLMFYPLYLKSPWLAHDSYLKNSYLEEWMEEILQARD